MADIDELACVTKCLHCGRDLSVDAPFGTYPGQGFCDKRCGIDYHLGLRKQGWGILDIVTALDRLFAHAGETSELFTDKNWTLHAR